MHNILVSPTGCAFGMMYLPAVVSVGYYFEKKRSVATGIAVCGTGIGTFCLAPFAKALLQVYDWKNAHLILGMSRMCIYYIEDNSQNKALCV